MADPCTNTRLKSTPPPSGGNALDISVNADAIGQGNNPASVPTQWNYTTAVPFTFTMSLAASSDRRNQAGVTA